MANCLYPAFIGAGDACEQLGLCKKSSGLLGDWTCDDCTAIMTRVAEFMKEPSTIEQGVGVLTVRYIITIYDTLLIWQHCLIYCLVRKGNYIHS